MFSITFFKKCKSTLQCIMATSEVFETVSVFKTSFPVALEILVTAFMAQVFVSKNDAERSAVLTEQLPLR